MNHESPLSRLMNILAQPQNQLVQVYVITVDNQPMLCIGPVIHESRHANGSYLVQDVTFGDILPASLAIRLLDGSAMAQEAVQ